MNSNHVDLEAYYHDKLRFLQMLQTLEQHYDRMLELQQGRLDTASKHRQQLQGDVETLQRSVEFAHQAIEDLETDRNRHNNELRLAFSILTDYKELFSEVLQRLEALETQEPEPAADPLPDAIVHLLAGDQEDGA